MRDSRFLVPATFLACMIFIYALNEFIWEPARRDMVNMQLETRRLNEVEREISELKARHGDLKSALAQKELELDAAREFLPQELEQENFIETLYRSADVWHVQIISVQTGDVDGDELQSQSITVKLNSQYVSFINFLREILDGERFTVLENFSLENAGGKFFSGELTFRIFAAH